MATLQGTISPETYSTVQYIIVQYSEYNVFADSQGSSC